MKKLKLSLSAIVLLLVIAVTSTQAQWVWNNRFVTGAGTFPSISVFSPTGIVVAGGPSGTAFIARSTNSGTNFTVLGTSGTSLEMYCVWAIDANTIYVGNGGAAGGAGGNASVYRTVNGGTSWTTVFSTGGTGGFFNSVVFSRSNPLVGVAQSDPPNGVGQPYYVQRTIDGGTTWAPVTCPGISGAASSQNGLVVIDANFFGFGLNAGASRVAVTANGGTSWTVQPLGVTGGFISGYAMHDNKLNGCACASASLPTIARTTNGTSWSTVNIGAGVTGYCNIKWVPGTNIVYVSGGTGAGGVVKKSIDAGLTWTQMTTAGITGITHMDLLVSGGRVYAYAITGDGSIISLDEPVAIDPTSTGVPTEYSIQQNYPNPFNPSTTIKYAIPQSGNVSIKIYDMLGSEVMTVVNKYHTTGNYIENIDLSGYASGVYYYSIVSGDFTQTKKMTLVK